jgi:hypothetical protein
MTWLIGTPFLLLLQYGVIRPAMWHAAITARKTGWVTRGPQVDESALSMVA